MSIETFENDPTQIVDFTGDNRILEKIEVVDIDSVLEDPSNARIHVERNLRSLMSSLQRWGQLKPIVISPKNIIIAGNGTHKAMKALGFLKIAVIRSYLDGPDAIAFAIADNQIALTSEWDFEILAQHVKGLNEFETNFDFDVLGFEAHEIDPMLSAAWAPPEIDPDDRNPDHESDEGPKMADPIKLTEDQRVMFDRVVNIIRKNESDNTISEGRCLEFICAEWMSDPNNNVAGNSIEWTKVSAGEAENEDDETGS